MFEPVGTFLQLLDPSKDLFNLNEPLIKQLKCLIDNQICAVLIRLWPFGLLTQLQKLQKVYEIIIFTILPREIMNQVYKLCPGLSDVIAHTLC